MLDEFVNDSFTMVSQIAKLNEYRYSHTVTKVRFVSEKVIVMVMMLRTMMMMMMMLRTMMMMLRKKQSKESKTDEDNSIGELYCLAFFGRRQKKGQKNLCVTV